jgi:hypothetical protein
MRHSCGWVEIGREKVLVVAPPRHPDGDGKIGEPPLWLRSHVDGLEIHWGLVSGPITTQPSILSARKAAPVVHAEMYGAGLTGGNADQVLQ